MSETVDSVDFAGVTRMTRKEELNGRSLREVTVLHAMPESGFSSMCPLREASALTGQEGQAIPLMLPSLKDG